MNHNNSIKELNPSEIQCVEGGQIFEFITNTFNCIYERNPWHTIPSAIAGLAFYWAINNILQTASWLIIKAVSIVAGIATTGYCLQQIKKATVGEKAD